MKTTVRFEFVNADYEIIAIHIVEFPSLTLPINDVIRYSERILSEYPFLYSYNPYLVK